MWARTAAKERERANNAISLYYVALRLKEIRSMHLSTHDINKQRSRDLDRLIRRGFEPRREMLNRITSTNNA